MSSGRITIISGAHGVPVAVTALREERSPSSSSNASPSDPGPTSEGSGAAGSGAAGSGAPGARGPADNPFAAPPKGSPDRPWQPRHPGSGGEQGGGDRWSSRQPEAHEGGPRDPFAGRPGGPQPAQERRPGQGGPGPEQGGPGQPEGRRPSFDVTDPVQRRARYALMGGTAGLFFALYGLPDVALLLGALALYWGVSALRGKARPAGTPAEQTRTAGADLSAFQSPRPPAAGAPRPAPATPPTWAQEAERSRRPQFAAAVGGTVASGLTLVLVAASFTFQVVYKDYYVCVNDALTGKARATCASNLPEPIRRHMNTGQDD